ncbi:hypothetical protein C7H19_02345 [Aphanothece hegewaldii CCALA 016]|uniref:Uncharacterized protein n=1 Tax=Aphanothece hegewaldii CCALA 016 TaxID=2107694 RepID=A0A2T1M2D4_9CHRO|nr:hypothetical protein [Aphanothece hegewaldii]PSF38915.1 hypothetical protein C7H19_02345 [Aphanothece hegewaldii CCALA 016]
MLLGQILLRKQWISPNQLERTVYQQQKSPRKLGEIMLQEGFIAEDQLEQALKEQYWRRNGYWVID